MSVVIERLDFPLSNQWTKFLTPLQLSYLDRTRSFNSSKNTNLIAWGIQASQDINPDKDIKCGILLSRSLEQIHKNGELSKFLSIVSIVIPNTKFAELIGPVLMRHVIEFASDRGFSGVHIACPLNGRYGNFIRQLVGSDAAWNRKQGKVVVRLSNIDQVGHLLTRLEKAVERQKKSAKWVIHPYDPSDIEMWKNRISFSRTHRLGVPWDPDDDTYDWEPSTLYSRVLKSQGNIIGWLICHFISENTLRYGKLWVDPGWEKSGAPLAMLCDVMRSAHFQGNTKLNKGQSVGNPIANGYFISHPTNIDLHRLVTNKFKAVADSWTELQNYVLYFDKYIDKNAGQ